MGNLVAPAGSASSATGRHICQKAESCSSRSVSRAGWHAFLDVIAFIGLLQVDYRVYNVEQLRERQRETIEQIVSILSISSEDALRVLRHCSW